MTSGRVRGALFLGALAVRLAALGFAIATGRFPELWEYEHLARNLISGKGFLYFHMGTNYRVYVEPLYPWLVAGVYLITGHSTLALAALQCLISALLAVIVYEVGRHTFGPRAGVAAGALVALHPGLAGYASKFHPLVLDALFIALVALAVLRLLQEPSLTKATVFGLALGACTLTRPTIITFIPPALAWMAWRRSPRFAATFGALSLAIAACLVAPWVIRNSVVLGTFTLTRSNTGFVFWLGNHPGATGGATDPSGTGSLFDIAPAEFKQRILSTDEVTQNRIFLVEALTYVRQDPAAFVGRTIKKLYYFWWFPPQAGKRYAEWQLLLYRGFYLALLALAVVGLASAQRQPEPGQVDGIALALLLLASISTAQALFYIDGRHRLAVEPVLILLSGRGLASISTVRGKTNIASLGRRNHAKARRSDFPPNQGIGVD
jgi:4-amino-4-deoxy-L-arabinose transferase-like glycosyltransferase